jgi:translocation and assembly module TamB
MPPTQFSLPLKLDATVKMNHVEWIGSTRQSIDKLSFHYVFDSYLHKIYLGHAHISSGDYEFSGQLQAQDAMALALKARGVVQTQLPQSQQALNVDAQAELSGALAGVDAHLVLQATLTPALTPSGSAGQQTAMQATLKAELAPWQPQKIISAHGQWKALDLAALWSAAPQTQLTGEARVSPAGQGWQAHVKLDNSLSGPWNQQRLPLQSLLADLSFANGQWALQSLQATGAGGSVMASGQINAGRWQGQATLQNILPAALDSRLAGATMSGTLQARQSAQGLEFEGSLQATPALLRTIRPAPQADTLQLLRLQSLAAKGLWSTPLLKLETLQINAEEAQLQGKLSYNTLSQATQGQLHAKLPGLETQIDGALSSTDGKGTLTVQVADAALTTRWLARWPGVNTLLKSTSLRGTADLNAQWQGGWQHQAQAMHIQASLRTPKLDGLNTTSSAPDAPNDWRLSNVQVDLSGSPDALSLKTRGMLTTGKLSLDLQTQANGGRLQSGAWRATLNQFRLAVQNGVQKTPWLLQAGDATGTPVTLDWPAIGQPNTLSISAGTARLQGPAPGTATLTWQPARWSQQTGQTASQWQSQGHIQNLPLIWLDTLGDKTMSDLGLSSDLLLAGDWNASQTDTLHLQATLERVSGDLRLRTDDSRQQVLPAGMHDAWMQVNLHGGQLAGSLRWDSERAGKALLAFSTQVQQSASGWRWPMDAPVGGSLQLNLPPVDAWSALAPPGWRLRGTMEANVALAGTQSVPQWTGNLQARDLAVRSAVDGVDFSQGSLSARLHDQQLDIQNFTLHGAGGASGGQLDLSGSVLWLPPTTTGNLASRVRIAFEADVKALRLNSRPDRRVVVSGKVSAGLSEARLTLRGALTADSALFTLPDDTTPQLGDDVVVRRPASLPASGAAGARQNPASAPATSKVRIAPDVQIDLDLGPDFQVRGRGLVTRLAGKLTLVAKDGAPLSLNGNVRTVRGTYQAYGQRLEIEQGVLRFTGPLDNPALTILAIRPKLTQRVGVQISGTALSPIVRLYAEPDLPDAEKLAWLVLGRSGSGGGAETALMQQAALALLGGNGKSLSSSLSQALGLDELSFSGKASASDTTSAASVTLGKRLSSDFYVAYESSLNGAMGVFYIFYDLSRRLTLRAQTGAQSAVDLIFTLRYD